MKQNDDTLTVWVRLDLWWAAICVDPLTAWGMLSLWWPVIWWLWHLGVWYYDVCYQLGFWLYGLM